MIKYRVSEPLLVAQKGIKGFRKTSILGEFTTIIGTKKLPIVHTLFDLVVNLLPKDGLIKPSVLVMNSLPKVTNNLNICDFSDLNNKYKSERNVMVFKYLINIKKEYNSKIQEDVITGILVDNLNRRYNIEVSKSGEVQKMRLIVVQNFNVNTTKVMKKQKTSVERKIITLPFNEKSIENVKPFSVSHKKIPIEEQIAFSLSVTN